MPMAFSMTVNCPACRTPFVMQIYNILDVGQEPELKRALLQGKVNVAVCPNCGQGSMLLTPFLYHDPDKELLLVFIPDQLSLKHEERERLIGNLVNSLMSTLPVEKRKGYLLQPKTLLSLERLMEEVLVADGVTPEMIEAQRQATRLIQQLLETKDNEEGLRALVEKHRAELDYEFFLLVSALIDAAQQDNDARRAADLQDLRSKLLELTAPSIPEPLPEGATREDLIEELLKAEDDQALEGLVISNRPLVDYIFFQTLTSRIEALEGTGDSAQAKQLKDLRAKLLDITDRLDKQARAAQQQVLAVIEELLASEDLDKALPEHAAEYDLLFFVMLRSMIESAEKAGQKELVDKLQDLHKRVIAFLEEQMPPELRLINRLLAAEYPEGTRNLLKEHAEEVTDDLVALLQTLAVDLERQGRANTAQRLKEIGEQAALVRAEAASSQPKETSASQGDI